MEGFPRSIRKSRDEYVAEAKVAEAAYDQNPYDKQNVKKWVDALMYVVGIKFSYQEEDLKLLYDARSKLEAAMEIEKHDYDTLFELGNVYYRILDWDTSLDRYGDDYKNLWNKAIACFKEVQDKAPDVCKDSGMLKSVERLLPRDWSDTEPYDEDLEEEEDLSDFAAVRRYKQYRKAAEEEFSRDSTNADNLHLWGRALMGLAFYTGEPTEKLELTEEAEKKFKVALELEPDDIYNKQALAKARLSICRLRKGDDYVYLLEEYNKLAKAAEEESRKRKRDS